MKLRIARKWSKGLRSGKYAQTSAKLCAVETDEQGRLQMCCLGVLCDIHAQETDGSWRNRTNSGRKEYLGQGGYLPVKVAKWAGIEIPYEEQPYVNPMIGKITASDYNDTKKRSFAQIAAAIDRNYKKI